MLHTMGTRRRSLHRVLSKHPQTRRMVWTGTAAVAALFLMVTSSAFAQYDPFFGTYDTPYVDYSSPTWTPTADSVTRGTSSSSSGSTSGSSSGTAMSGSSTVALPAGAVAVTLNGTKAPVHYRDGSGEEKNAVGDWTLMKIYARSPLGTANYTQSVGVITKKSEGASYITGEGYIFPDKLPGAAKSTTVVAAPSSVSAAPASAATSTPSSSAASAAAPVSRVPSDDAAAPAPVIREAPSTSPSPSAPTPTSSSADVSPSSGATDIAVVHTPTDRVATATAVGASLSALQETAAATLVAHVLDSATLSAVGEPMRAAMVTYVAYGHTPETAKIGAGERASTIERFRLLYGVAPTSDVDFRALQAMVIESGVDIVKVKRAIEAEKKGLGAFRRIYGYLPATTVRDQTLIDAEWKALRIITYGLKPLHRDLAKERTAIRAYTAKFGQPKAIGDWDSIRACVYGSPTTCPLLR